MKQHKNGTIIVAAGSAIVGTSGLVYNKVKNHEPKVVTEFRTNLRIYINEIRKCDVGIDKINNLMNPLDILKADKNYPKISIRLTSEELEILVRRVYEYTLKLAIDNEMEITADDLGKEKDTIRNL